MTNKIDFVITWVDGNDPEWQKERNKYLTEKVAEIDDLNSDCRFREMGTLRYWFRTVERYAPWVNKIHFITCGHLPKWLNTNNEKLNIIKHSDYIPSDYLPTFNSRVIEFNLHRIKELSEYFVLFNDDMFLNDYVREEFFFKNGLPRGSAILSPIFPVNSFRRVIFNSTILLNRNFDFRTSVRKNFRKFFSLQYGRRILTNIFYSLYKDLCGFKESHTANPLLKSVLKEIWEKEGKTLDKLSRNKFRTSEDIIQWLIKNWQYMSGKFVPIRPGYSKFFYMGRDNVSIIKSIKDSKYKVICINDGETNNIFEESKKAIIETFEEKFPQKSSFEKD